MRNVAFLFYATAAVFALIGMGWGIVMSATHDHALSPAHGHLNLIGFVAMAVFGTYYALTPRAASSLLARLHYGVTVAAVLVLIPGIVAAIRQTGELGAQLGALLGMAAMALFLVVVLIHGVGAAPETGRRLAATPAE
ncbi:hypothetical protein [Roseitranquillus sediminis]|uniref:hypothetical protein n=1 Tax=Roseitranquillus sediminis TaxID=2809051 RepID=UPI001D0C37F0|nr:hypothetical protein [Roseitranquillus sediminis]MBM9593445.1 hypothetical protein [Roseitranquillus sediminis]